MKAQAEDFQNSSWRRTSACVCFLVKAGLTGCTICATLHIARTESRNVARENALDISHRWRAALASTRSRRDGISPFREMNTPKARRAILIPAGRTGCR